MHHAEFFCIFAPEKMKKERKRIVSAWLLLSVFVSMMMLSGLHRHEVVANATIDCADCAHHVHHSGHLMADSNHMDDCVLCQFLSLVYTPATALLVVIPLSLTIQAFVCSVNLVPCEADLYHPTRAPPFIL